MALGNIYGGRSADKNPDPDKLYGRIIIAAIWIALIPVVGKYIILGISALLIFTVSSNFLIIAGFVACMVIFVFPLFLLGTVTPSLVKYTVDNLDDNGKMVGNLNAIDDKYDVIMVDAYQDITIPFQMSSVEFFELLKEHLKEDGVMVVNMSMRGTEEGNINQYLAEEDNEQMQNMMQKVSSDLVAYEAGDYIMTDDRAPVELLGMKVIDELIKDEVGYYKQIYKDGGVKALLEML